MKKVKKDFWEKILLYPSFNRRFGFALVVILIFFLFFTHFVLFRLQIVEEISDQIAVLDLITQGATLLLAILATYYALRQLVETRFTSLNEAGTQEIKRKHYSRAFDKWKEAFYIRPEALVFASLCESLLLIGDFDTFDEYMKIPEWKKEIFQEVSDQIILLYLKSIRHLLVKNQGEAEKYLSEIVILASEKDALASLHWDFIDLQISSLYLDLSGECKKIAENLILYLSKTMSIVRKRDFEAKNFASQVT